MIRSIGCFVDLDAAHATDQILRRENEVTTVRPVRPLRAVVDPAGRHPRATGTIGSPRIPIIETAPAGAVDQGVLGIGDVEIEIAAHQTRCSDRLAAIWLIVPGAGLPGALRRVLLQIAHILHWRKLVEWRRYAVVAIFVVDAVITPSGDPVTLLAMAIPMCLFYEASILVGRFALRR